MKATVAAALLSATTLGASAAEGDSRWYLQVDNDVLFGSDRWYTSGVHLARVHRSGDHEVEWGLMQEIYTPEGRRFTPGTVDRAPVGRLMLSVARHDTNEPCFQTLQLALGVRGRAALGRQTTEAVHEVVPSSFVDWEREEKTQVDAMAAATRSHRYGNAVVHYGGVLGNTRTFVHGGAQLNYGPVLHSPVMRFAPTPPPAAGSPQGWSAFIGASARAVFLDKLLERSYDEFLAEPDRKRVIGRFAAGIGSAFAWGSVSLSAAVDTREFEGQRQPHRYGSLMVHLEF